MADPARFVGYDEKAAQAENCARGEHEARYATTPDQPYFIANGASVEVNVCRHCGCLYAEP